MATILEALPIRPRKASAGRRRRHHTQLPYRLDQIAPGAATILITPVWTDARGPMERTFLARALDTTGQKIRFPAGGSRQIASLMQGAFPAADWDRVQTWHADTNTLTTRRPTTTRDLNASIQRLENRAAGLEAELAYERERNFELATARDFADSKRTGYVNTSFLED
jgi:hypothetical protein